jgi:hypothetical protein
MLSAILGSATAEKVLLHVFHHGESYGSAVAKDFKLSLGQVQRQFDRLEVTGLLISKLTGKTRIYKFNQKSAYYKPFLEIVRITYESIPLTERQNIFSERRRARRKGKPIIKS